MHDPALAVARLPSPPSPAWARRNRVTLLVLAVILLAAAALGTLTPPGAGLLSSARAYNVFHLAAGGAALAVWASGRPRAAAAYNFAFGLFDLYQAAAAALDLAPARLFALQPADHVAHVVIGAGLVAIAIHRRNS